MNTWIARVLLKFLFSINCQTTRAYISITCGSAIQWITWFLLTCGFTTLWECGSAIFRISFSSGLVYDFPPSLTLAFRATRIPTVGVDIPVNGSFQSYQNPKNFKSWCSCSFQSYISRNLGQRLIVARKGTFFKKAHQKFYPSLPPSHPIQSLF